MFNPAKAADEIKKEYMGYISTTFHFRNQELQKRLGNELDNTVSNGPFVEIKDTFVTGKSIEEMIVGGMLSPLFRNLESGKRYEAKLPISRPLYLHQEKAIEKIVAGKNIVVSTGTGSGKTNCFLI
ncbi:MAG: DEAD/DEAH box helicase, partial [Clostridiales bacterium]|nr:DEAD/DEAH box helicase [Clostridiales bacterium]